MLVWDETAILSEACQKVRYIMSKISVPVGLYCQIVDEPVLWVIKHDRRCMEELRVHGTCSAYCSRYMKYDCLSYGKASECTSLMNQAIAISIENLGF